MHILGTLTSCLCTSLGSYHKGNRYQFLYELDNTLAHVGNLTLLFGRDFALPMKRVQATLPTLGTIPIDFYKESEEVILMMGDKELRRLRRVPHLGVAASVFTGINHSRLEYMLLQCAVIGLVAKLHRLDEQFALSNQVRLDGLQTPISSGEELLKIWALLSNFGHAQYTYGVERGLLQYALSDGDFKQWMSNSTRLLDLRSWCREAIDSYSDRRFHLLIALLRLSHLPPRDRRKTKFAHYIRNLVLPINTLLQNNHTAQYKLNRLRALFARIRLLSIITLDSHYSHHPVSIQLNSAILSLADLTSMMSESGFDRMLSATGGWLADELYLHPESVAVQREYELRVIERLPARLSKANTPRRRIGLFNDLISSGFGSPSSKVLSHLVRLSFNAPRQQLLGRDNLYKKLVRLERDLVSPPSTYVSIDRNPFSNAVHVDILYRSATADPQDIASVYTKLQRWLIRAVEADALSGLRRIYPGGSRSDDPRFAQMFRNLVERRLEREAEMLHVIFASIIQYLLPEGWKANVSEFMPSGPLRQPILSRIRRTDGTEIDNVTPELKKHIEDNPLQLSKERLQELEALSSVFDRSQAPFVLVCAEKFLVRDEFGRTRDDWDGTMIEIDDRNLDLTVVEAKTGGTAKRRENDAFSQLSETRNLLLSRHRISYRRRRLSGLGACIRFTLVAH